jgi:PadR family transcriptional regulator, regulatory protein PadR
MGLTTKPRTPGTLVQGTLDMLILKTLSRGLSHGYAIALSIQSVSEEVLRVEEGSLYPAQHRLELDGLIDSECGLSDNNRRAKFYRLTAAGLLAVLDPDAVLRLDGGARIASGAPAAAPIRALSEWRVFDPEHVRSFSNPAERLQPQTDVGRI